MLSTESRSYARRGKNDIAITFTPPNNLDNQGLFALFQEILNKVEVDSPREIIMDNVPKVTLGQRRDHILKHIRNGGKISFRTALADAKTKVDVIVTFLAILEMVKQKEVRVEQDNNFSDFMIIGVK